MSDKVTEENGKRGGRIASGSELDRRTSGQQKRDVYGDKNEQTQTVSVMLGFNAT